MRRLTTEEFKDRFRERYGDLYNLDKVEYKSSKEEIVVTCPTHGDFKIKPIRLLDGGKCPKCSKTRGTTEEEFIEKARYVHNGFFTYEDCNFVSVSSIVGVTCPLHGKWFPKANNHLNGANCPKCSNEGITHEVTKLPSRNKSTRTYTTEEFKEKVRERIGDKYLLDNIEYKGHKEYVYPICRKHGEFKILPIHLLNGRGCPKCARNYRYTTNEIIDEFKKVHGDKYDYSKVNYVRTHDNVTITCKVHGDFEMSPSNHLRGQGCPMCRQSKLENEVSSILSENGIEFKAQQTFDWLGRQSLDFYIPSRNIAIECQGLQHFKAVEGFGGEDRFEETKRRDSLKRRLCEEHGIHVIYYSNLGIEYPYKVIEDKDELLEQISMISK